MEDEDVLGPEQREGTKEERRQVVGEVLELGEELFELALEGSQRTRRKKDASAEKGEEKSNGDEKYPVEELRAATAEFFAALRLVLKEDLKGEDEQVQGTHPSSASPPAPTV